MAKKIRSIVFTLNNYTEADVERIQEIGLDRCRFICYGKEVGESGTPHLQGFCYSDGQRSFKWWKELIGGNPHIEKTKGPLKKRSRIAPKTETFGKEVTALFPEPSAEKTKPSDGKMPGTPPKLESWMTSQPTSMYVTTALLRKLRKTTSKPPLTPMDSQDSGYADWLEWQVSLRPGNCPRRLSQDGEQVVGRIPRTRRCYH